jgi:hypothetical protein
MQVLKKIILLPPDIPPGRLTTKFFLIRPGVGKVKLAVFKKIG